LELISFVTFILDNFGSKAGEITEFGIMRQFKKDWDVQQSVLQSRAHNPALFSARLNLYLFQQTDGK